jgi:ribonuclease P protein component
VALSKANRLTNRQDFRAVFREGIRRQGSHLTLRALRSKENAYNPQEQWAISTKSNTQLTPTRIGISISTKVSKRATVRNRIKRQIRSAFRWLLPELLPGWRLVVVVQPLAAQEQCDYNQFLQELKQLLAEAEVLNGHS